MVQTYSTAKDARQLPAIEQYMLSYIALSGIAHEGGAIMKQQAIPIEPTTSYKEVRIGKTIFRVTSVFSGEKDLGKTLEQLAVRRALTESASPSPAIGAD